MKFLQGLLVAAAMVALGATGASADLLGLAPGQADAYGAGTPISGSFFNLQANVLLAPGTDGGIIENQAQAPGEIDQAWNFSGNLGNIWASGSGVDRTSFANIMVAWGPAPAVPMGTAFTVPTPAAPFWVGGDLDFDNNGSVTGLEFMDNGDGTYVLNYGGRVPDGDPSGFGGALWFLHMEGDLVPTAVPEPMSMALVGSSLIGLIGLRRKFTA